MTVEQDIERRAGDRVGTVLRGKYRLERLLGVGGMGAVFAAIHTNNRNRVAIKMLHTELSINAEIKSRFLREGYIANTVEHPGVVRVLDDDTSEDGAVFLVLDLLEGETLEAKLERVGKLGPVEVARVAIELLDILSVAHDKGIVHRDIKPDNVFVTHHQAVKILDFGIARLKEATGGSGTRSGQSIGTPAYMAPEQALGHMHKVGPHSDVWSVGATMFTLLTGRFAHDGESLSELLVRAATQPVTPIEKIEKGVPVELANVIDQALAFDIAHRWKSAAEMRRALVAVLPALQSKVRTPSAPDIGGTPSSRDDDIERAPTERPPPLEATTGPTGAVPLDLSAPTPVVAFAETLPERAPPWPRPFVVGGVMVAASVVVMLAILSQRGSKAPPRSLATSTSAPVASQPLPSPATPPSAVVATATVETPVPATSVTALPKPSKVRAAAAAAPPTVVTAPAVPAIAAPPSARPPTKPKVDPLDRQ